MRLIASPRQPPPQKKAKAEAKTSEAAREAERKAKELEAANKARKLQLEAEAKQRAAEEVARAAEEAAALQRRQEEEKRRLEEARRKEEEAQRLALEAARRREEAQRREEEVRRAAAAAVEAQKRDEEARTRAAEAAARLMQEQQKAAAAAATSSHAPGQDPAAVAFRARLKDEDAKLVARGQKFADGWSGKEGAFFNVATDEVEDSDISRFRKFAWKSHDQIAPAETRKLIPAGGYSTDDIKQGMLGDCYLLACFAALAAGHADLLDDVFISRELSPSGIYGVRLWKNGKWQEITVDDTFAVKTGVCIVPGGPATILINGEADPSEKRWWRQAFVNAGHVKPGSSKEALPNGVLWPMLLEKAYAKYYGSFASIDAGVSCITMTDFIPGSAYEIVSLAAKASEIASGQLWESLKRWYSLGYLLGAGSPAGSDSDVSDLGIAQGHAYSMLRVAEESDAKGTHQLVQLRNPWGATEWTGEWSDKDTASWSRRMQTLLKYDPTATGATNDGSFWMKWADFTTYFSELYVTKVLKTAEKGGQWNRYSALGEWKGQSAGGRNGLDTFENNPQFKLEILRPSNLFIILETATVSSSKDRMDSQGLTIGVKFLDKKGLRAKAVYAGEAVLNQNYKATTKYTMEGASVPAGNYTVIPTAWDAGAEASFSLTVYSDEKLGSVGPASTLQLIPSTVPSD